MLPQGSQAIFIQLPYKVNRMECCYDGGVTMQSMKFSVHCCFLICYCHFRRASFSDADVQAIAELLKLCPRAQKIWLVCSCVTYEHKCVHVLHISTSILQVMLLVNSVQALHFRWCPTLGNLLYVAFAPFTFLWQAFVTMQTIYQQHAQHVWGERE